MKPFLAILVALIPTVASGQVVYYYDVQCWGGCPQRQYCPPQPRYQQRPPQRGPAPDGIETEPAEPEFKPLLPPPPPVQTPPMEPKVEPEPIESKLVPIQKRIDESQAATIAAIEANKCNCQPTDLTQVNAKLDLILAGVAAKPTEPPKPTAEEHVVIVADHNAPYWQRLSEAITNARKTYSGIMDTTLPTFPIGVHPQAVVYRNSVPVRIVKGQYEVESVLSRLARGESI